RYASDKEQLEAMERLADGLQDQWLIRERRIYVALLCRAHAEGKSVQVVKRDELLAAIPLVLCEDMTQPQFVKSGSEWWCDNGRKAPVRPDDLPLFYAYGWADRRIIAVAEAAILEMSLEEYQAYRSRKAVAGRKAREGHVLSDDTHCMPL